MNNLQFLLEVLILILIYSVGPGLIVCHLRDVVFHEYSEAGFVCFTSHSFFMYVCLSPMVLCHRSPPPDHGGWLPHFLSPSACD